MQKLSERDPEAKIRRGEILLELADQMQRIGQSKEAAALYAKLLNEKSWPDREEEIMQRWTNALASGGRLQGIREGVHAIPGALPAKHAHAGRAVLPCGKQLFSHPGRRKDSGQG